MTTTPSLSTTTSASTGVPSKDGRSSAAPEGVPRPPKLRRRPVMVIVSAALVLLGGLVGVWAWSASTATTEVVATRTAIQRGTTIGADDLLVVRVNPDPALRLILGERLGSLVGQRAATDLVAGSLVSPEEVTPDLPPAAGLSVVGVVLEVGQLPAEPLRVGDRVRLVQTPGGQADFAGEAPALAAEVAGVRDVESRVVVDLLVTAELAPEVAARAGTGRVGLVLDERER